jgi:putative tricarboxylic transport membrane protein
MPAGTTVRIGELALGVAAAAVGVAALVDAAGLQRFGTHGVPGPGFFPDLVAVLLIVLGLLLALASRRHRSPGDDAPDGPAAIEPVSSSRRGFAGLPRVARVWLGFVVAIPLLELIGFVPATVALVAYLAVAVERVRAVRAIPAAIVIPVSVYLLFAYLLGVDLPGPALFGTS